MFSIVWIGCVIIFSIIAKEKSNLEHTSRPISALYTKLTKSNAPFNTILLLNFMNCDTIDVSGETKTLLLFLAKDFSKRVFGKFNK
jgi:hypothetical protein